MWPGQKVANAVEIFQAIVAPIHAGQWVDGYTQTERGVLGEVRAVWAAEVRVVVIIVVVAGLRKAYIQTYFVLRRVFRSFIRVWKLVRMVTVTVSVRVVRVVTDVPGVFRDRRWGLKVRRRTTCQGLYRSRKVA